MNATQDEILDILNEAGEVIGQASFTEAHQRDLLHRNCRVLVFTSAGDVVLHRRVGGKQAGKLDSGGGHLSAGEDSATAAARELQEEMGITADLTPLKGQMCFQEKGHENMLGSVFIATHDGPYVESSETTRFEVVPVAEVDRLMAEEPHKMARQMQEAWRVYKESLRA